MSAKPPMKPPTGENTIAYPILVRLGQFSTARPPAASPAPIIPATRECVMLMGIPRRVHTPAHDDAPISAARTTGCVTASATTIPLPMVFATSVVKHAPRTFSVRASRMAWRGGSARGLTDVGIAFAASFLPLEKSYVHPTGGQA